MTWSFMFVGEDLLLVVYFHQGHEHASPNRASLSCLLVRHATRHPRLSTCSQCTLRQTTRDDVVHRMGLYPDGTWSANRAKRSGVSTLCARGQPGGGTCGC
ncbi:hypothetical protein CALCODRAFT_556222, partial [Calocera cornea HHB12733]